MPQGCRTAPVTGRRSLVVLFWPAGWMACSALVGLFVCLADGMFACLFGRWNVCLVVWLADGLFVCLVGVSVCTPMPVAVGEAFEAMQPLQLRTGPVLRYELCVAASASWKRRARHRAGG